MRGGTFVAAATAGDLLVAAVALLFLAGFPGLLLLLAVLAHLRRDFLRASLRADQAMACILPLLLGTAGAGCFALWRTGGAFWAWPQELRLALAYGPLVVSAAYLLRRAADRRREEDAEAARDGEDQGPRASGGGRAPRG